MTDFCFPEKFQIFLAAVVWVLREAEIANITKHKVDYEQITPWQQCQLLTETKNANLDLLETGQRHVPRECLLAGTLCRYDRCAP